MPGVLPAGSGPAAKGVLPVAPRSSEHESDVTQGTPPTDHRSDAAFMICVETQSFPLRPRRALEGATCLGLCSDARRRHIVEPTSLRAG